MCSANKHQWNAIIILFIYVCSFIGLCHLASSSHANLWHGTYNFGNWEYCHVRTLPILTESRVGSCQAGISPYDSNQSFLGFWSVEIVKNCSSYNFCLDRISVCGSCIPLFHPFPRRLIIAIYFGNKISIQFYSNFVLTLKWSCGAIFIWVSNVIRICFAFALLHSVIGLKTLSHFLHQSEVKPKHIMAYSHAYCGVLRWLQVFASIFDCFTGLPVFFVMGPSDYFGLV